MKKSLMWFARQKFGQKLHGNLKLNAIEEDILNRAIEEAADAFAKQGITLPRNIPNKSKDGLLSQEQSNRVLYNVLRNKDPEDIAKSVQSMENATTRTPFLKMLEEVGIETPDWLKRSIMRNRQDKNQSPGRMPKEYIDSMKDVDPTLPSKSEMYAEIYAYWLTIRDNATAVPLMPSQRLELDHLIDEMGRLFNDAEMSYFYVMHFEQTDVFEYLALPYEPMFGEGSVYTNGMEKFKEAIDDSRGRTFQDVPNYEAMGEEE